MRLVALVESLEHVCCRYRVAAFRPFFEAAGHTLDIRPLPRGLFARAGLFRSLRSADLVVLQRKLLPSLELALLRRAVKALAFDLDDAVWLRDSYAPKGPHSPRRVRRFARTVRTADVVIGGNPFLANAARRHGAIRTEVIPTCVEPADYPVARHQPKPGLRLVWVGSSSTLQGLERMRPILEAIGRNVPGVRLHLVCDRGARFEALPVDLVPWSEATEAAAIAAADVGIAWMPDDDWSRGKCGLKILQYQAAGLPVVANPVGVHATLVRPAESGFLAATAEDWWTAVRELADDTTLRTMMGAVGRCAVEDRFGVAAGAGKWLALLESLSSRRKCG